MAPSLYALNDRGRWGLMAVAEALTRGWSAGLVDRPEQVPAGAYVFARIDQVRPRLAKDKRFAEAVVARGVRVIPDIDQIRLYEDKVAQAEAFPSWFPKTAIVRSPGEVDQALRAIGLPLISKMAEGSGSHDVRLIPTRAQAEAEARQAFSGAGIRGSLAVQKGYLLWQRFCHGNAYDYRVICNGSQRLLLKRWNRADRPMASGSGRTEAVTEVSGETEEVLQRANGFFRAARTQWCGVDMVRDPDDRSWKVLETTLGWTLSAYLRLPYFDASGRPTGRIGAEQFKVLCDELAAGAFANAARPA